MCNLYASRCRLLQKILCSHFRSLQLCTCSVNQLVWIPCESLPNTIRVFIQSPRLPRRILVSTLPVSVRCLYLLLAVSHHTSKFTLHSVELNFAHHNMACGVCCLVAIVLITQMTVALSTSITICFLAEVTGITNWNSLFATACIGYTAYSITACYIAYLDINEYLSYLLLRQLHTSMLYWRQSSLHNCKFYRL